MLKIKDALKRACANPIELVLFIVLAILIIIGIASVLDTSGSLSGWIGRRLGIEEAWGKGKYEVLTVIGLVIVGVGALFALYYAGKRANAMDATARAQARNAENAEAGLTQERLRNAIEHLGHKMASVRMGGAYEIFLLAKENMSDRDFVQNLLDILCSHIRQTTRGQDYQQEYKSLPSEEIQSLVQLLFMDKHDVFEFCHISLHGSHLNGVTFVHGRLNNAGFWGAQLESANFIGSHLQGAVFWEANMQSAILHKTRMQGAEFINTQLQNAELNNAQLQGVTLRHSHLQSANLSNAQLQGATLNNTNLHGATIKDLNLQGVSYQIEHDVSSVEGFEKEIQAKIGKKADLDGIFFTEGMSYEDLVSEGVKMDSYTEAEAEQWIKEYREAIKGFDKS